MIVVILALLGLCAGSFVNALVWRIHKQAKTKKGTKRYSIVSGRSMCPHCEHELAPKDLIPLLSWLSLNGKCRYCKKPISKQYPLVEVVGALVFVSSYVWWPVNFGGWQTAIFVTWLVISVGLLALVVYDIKWGLLPNRILYPIAVIAVLQAIMYLVSADRPAKALLGLILATAVGGGIFYVLFQVSSGKWIGGGDVKLGWLLGLIVGTPAKAILLIFIASLIGTALTVPLLLTHRLKRTSTIPFGPLLITGAIITVLFGASILSWYKTTFFIA